MDEVVKLVVQKAGISEAQAHTAVATVVGFLKERLPQPVAGQIDQFLGAGGGAPAGLGDMAKGLGGMFGGDKH